VDDNTNTVTVWSFQETTAEHHHHHHHGRD
jgi:hypothetical protein